MHWTTKLRLEHWLVRAVAERYAWPVPEDRSPLDQAYADAMEKVWHQFPDDPDVGALYAESLMNWSHGTCGQRKRLPRAAFWKSWRYWREHCPGRPIIRWRQPFLHSRDRGFALARKGSGLPQSA